MKNKKLLFVGAGLITFGVIVAVVIILVLGNTTAASNKTPLSAIDYVNAFVADGLPIDNIIEYDEETDVNGLLGRPGQYISKVNFADMRCEQYDAEDPVGGTVEVFATSADMHSRKDYIEALQEEMSILVDAYIYVSADELGLLRVSFDLTPIEAQEYANIFENKNIRDYIAETKDELSSLPSGNAPDAQVTPHLTDSIHDIAQEAIDSIFEEAQKQTSTPAPEPTAGSAAETKPATTVEATQPPAAAPSSTPQQTQEAAATPTPVSTDAGQTSSQKNALKTAKQYLDFSAFSYEGLIDQLEYEKYSHEDAVYAADNCGADWNEQALKSAKQYLSYSAFSHSGLIGQLEYEKFTSEQAKYGADNCGADWNEQAVKAAKQYLDYSSFSRNSLIDQLEYEGFTHEQAVYGVEANGL
jgi:hypothetical protein